MMNDLNMMSLLSRLGPLGLSQIGTPNAPQVGQEPDSTTDPLVAQRLTELFTPQTTATNKLRDYESQAPNRDDPAFAPNKFRKVGAVLAGLGTGTSQGIAGGQPIGFKSDIPTSLKVQDAIRNEPFYKAKSDYEDRLKPLSEAAEAEGRLNTANRQIGTSLLTNERMTRSNESLAKHRDNQDKATNEKIEISRQRALAYDFKTRNPNYKSFIDSEGKLVFVNPQNPADIKQTGIDTGKLSDADKLSLQIEGRLETIKAQGDETRKNEDNAEENRETLESTRYPNGRPVKPATDPNKPATPAAQNRALINKANQVVSEHPEWKKFFEIGAQGVKIKPAGAFAGEATKAERLKAYNAVYGQAPLPSSSTKPAATSVTPTGKVKVEKDGKQFYLPESQLKDATAQGYKQVK